MSYIHNLLWLLLEGNLESWLLQGVVSSHAIRNLTDRQMTCYNWECFSNWKRVVHFWCCHLSNVHSRRGTGILSEWWLVNFPPTGHSKLRTVPPHWALSLIQAFLRSWLGLVPLDCASSFSSLTMHSKYACQETGCRQWNASMVWVQLVQLKDNIQRNWYAVSGSLSGQLVLCEDLIVWSLMLRI